MHGRIVGALRHGSLHLFLRTRGVGLRGHVAVCLLFPSCGSFCFCSCFCWSFASSWVFRFRKISVAMCVGGLRHVVVGIDDRVSLVILRRRLLLRQVHEPHRPSGLLHPGDPLVDRGQRDAMLIVLCLARYALLWHLWSDHLVQRAYQRRSVHTPDVGLHDLEIVALVLHMRDNGGALPVALQETGLQVAASPVVNPFSDLESPPQWPVARRKRSTNGSANVGLEEGFPSVGAPLDVRMEILAAGADVRHLGRLV